MLTEPIEKNYYMKFKTPNSNWKKIKTLISKMETNTSDLLTITIGVVESATESGEVTPELNLFNIHK